MIGFLVNQSGWNGQTVPDFDYARYETLRPPEPRANLAPCVVCGQNTLNRIIEHPVCPRNSCMLRFQIALEETMPQCLICGKPTSNTMYGKPCCPTPACCLGIYRLTNGKAESTNAT